jgi:alpha-maltose-1-phosphate synthase
VPDNARIVLFCGQLIAEKGVLQLLRASHILTARDGMEDVHFVIVGEGAERPRLETVIARLGLGSRVRLAGRIPYERMAAVHNTADVFVLPSLDTPTWREQFGMVLAESMACGKPIVTTRSGSIPEVVGPAAILVDSYHVQQLADAIMAVLGDASLADRLRRDSIHRSGRYDAARTASALRQTYLEVAI